LLHGVPIGIKDLTATADIRTTFGSPLHADHVPSEDAAVVKRIKQAGAIVVGKTNTPEFDAGANTVNRLFGATRKSVGPRLKRGRFERRRRWPPACCRSPKAPILPAHCALRQHFVALWDYAPRSDWCRDQIIGPRFAEPTILTAAKLV
jgi:hypothetical protein